MPTPINFDFERQNAKLTKMLAALPQPVQMLIDQIATDATREVVWQMAHKTEKPEYSFAPLVAARIMMILGRALGEL